MYVDIGQCGYDKKILNVRVHRNTVSRLIFYLETIISLFVAESSGLSGMDVLR